MSVARLHNLERRSRFIPMNNPPPLTAQEAAEILGVSRWTVRRWVKSDYIRPSHQLPGTTGARLFDRAEVDRIKALRERKPAA